MYISIIDVKSLSYRRTNVCKQCPYALWKEVGKDVAEWLKLLVILLVKSKVNSKILAIMKYS
jgi:hypothetical protein